MDDIIFDMQATLSKIFALTDAIKANGFLDLTELDQEQQALLLHQHSNTTQLFAVLEDYLVQADELNSKLCDAINNATTVKVKDLRKLIGKDLNT
jgi:hypothetical protein